MTVLAALEQLSPHTDSSQLPGKAVAAALEIYKQSLGPVTK